MLMLPSRADFLRQLANGMPTDTLLATLREVSRHMHIVKEELWHFYRVRDLVDLP